jgi:hypothetical protein
MHPREPTNGSETTTAPHIDRLADLAHLDQSIRQDFDGARARALIECFAAAARETELLLERTPPDERALVTGMFEGYEAAQRIVHHLWRHRHRSLLAT